MHLEYLFRTVITLYDNTHIITLAETLYTANLHMAIPKSKHIPSIFKDESTGSCICLWKLAVAVATYVSICIV
jgi:hypothetical protein